MSIEEIPARAVELAMAFNRDRFIQDLRDDHLKGAFGEFMCRQIALSVNEPDNWSNEVRKLLSHADEMRDPSKTKIKGFTDRDLACCEAVSDMRVLLQSKVTFARSKVAGYYPKKLKKIYQLKFDNEQQFKLMLEEFLPSFIKYLDP